MLNFKIARMKKGLSQKEVAKILKVNVNTVSRWETGAQKITIDNLLILADLYNTSTDFLLGRKGVNED